MALRPAFLSLLLVLVPLAGCLGGADDGDIAPAGDEGDGPNVTAPEGRNRPVAFEETNATEDGVGGLDHHHDYWAGRERVVIFEQRAEMWPRPNSQNEAFVTFRPIQGSFVYEATESVEFTIKDPARRACEPLVQSGGRFVCTNWPVGTDLPDPTGGSSGLKLRYKHAATTEWIDGGPLEWGAPLALKITNPIQTDMPHVTSSLWEFEVVSPNAHDVTLAFTAKAEIVKSTDENVPLWPGHPDFYKETPHRVVVDTTAASGENGYSGAGVPIRPDDAGPIFADKLISYGTRTLYVWANVSEYQAPNPATAPSTWFLFHRNATGRDNITNAVDRENYGIDKRELHWILPVDDNGMDSPYADGSRWNFELGAAYTPPAGGSTIYRGLGNWMARYTLVIHASSVELPPDDYHMNCLQIGDYCGE